MLEVISNTCVLIGDPVSHSLSPLLQQSAYCALGIEGTYSYSATQVKPSNLVAAIRNLRLQNVCGIACTIPHKSTVIPLLDEVDETASTIGAVNTIVQNQGKLKGFNTDWMGVYIPLTERLPLAKCQVALLGAGGAARAALYALKLAESNVTIFNRTKDKALALSDEFKCSYGSTLSNARELKMYDVIINTTSVGMHPHVDESPITADCFRAGQTVFDAVYTPAETKFIRLAKEKGARVIYGAEMLLHQAVGQFKFFTGREAPVEIMKEVLAKNLFNGKTWQNFVCR